MLWLSRVQGEIIDKVGQYRLAVWSDVVVVTCTRGDKRQDRTISSCSVVRCCFSHVQGEIIDKVRQYRLAVSVVRCCFSHVQGEIIDKVRQYHLAVSVVRCCVRHMYKGR